MKLHSWILFWIFFVQAVHGLNSFEIFLRDFLVDLIRGPKPPRYLADFPRCGKTGTVIDVPGTQGCSCDNKCGYGEGRCSGDSECQGDLVCGSNNCKSFPNGEAAKSGWDCCTIDQTPPAAPPDVGSFTDTIVVSPMYPNVSGNNADVTWIINSTSGFIEMKIHYFELEDTCSCSSDSVEIVTNGQSRYLYCGKLEVPWSRNFSGPTLEIRFKSDGSVSKRGFLATLKCGASPRQCITEKTVKTIETDKIIEEPAFENSVFSAPPERFGICTSPNYPQNYNNNYKESVICNITADDPTNNIEIVFTDIAIEAANYQKPTKCGRGRGRDYVRIEEELMNGVTSSLLGRRCGYSLPDRILNTRSSTVRVYFKADSSGSLRGFKLVWGEIKGPAEISTTIPPPRPERNCKSLTSSQTDLNCCTEQNPCGYGEGDCDNDDECAGELR